mmetsp:Transcript_13006/g.29606  ORF Transcript_13006/g.29606 Transcript_13006/m.29606 type:complete len:708 (-) Transcript_13006:11-2134(-)
MAAVLAAPIFQTMTEVVTGAQAEIAIFIIAILTHAVFYGKYHIGSGVKQQEKAKKPQVMQAASRPASCTHAATSTTKSGAVPAAEHSNGAPTRQRWKEAPEQQLPRAVRVRPAAQARPEEGSRRHEDALKQFEACTEKTACHYNTMLHTCIENRDMAAADKIMSQAVSAGMADVVTYNTMVKAHIQRGDLAAAHAAVATMQSSGLHPNSVTYNELLDATIAVNPSAAWKLISQMQAAGLKPNPITTSIFLKCIQPSSDTQQVERAMRLVDQMADQMDEVLLSSVVEACVRVGRCDLLKRHLDRQRTRHRVQVRGAHTYGSLIRAFGALQDLGGAWDSWREMRSMGILPTSVTFGCMVEALVSNGDTDGAHKLIKESLEGDQTRPLVNAVIFCSVIKGYSHQQRFDGAWKVYEELISLKIQFTVVTYNALIDACVRCGEISRAPALLEDMMAKGIQPNLVTYSSILKGYCQENQLDRAFDLLDHIKVETHFRPDEVTYNTLLDGCARQGLYERGVALLEEMETVGVRPSNYTLSVLVKLASRGKRLQKAFDLCDEIVRKYKFSLNIHVYNNLMHACIANKNMGRALEVLEEMLDKQVRPDIRSYVLVLRGCVSAGQAEDAVGLLRAATGLGKVHPRLERFRPSILVPKGDISPEVVSDVLESLARQPNSQPKVLSLLSDLRQLPRLRIDQKTVARLTSKAIRSSPSQH